MGYERDAMMLVRADLCDRLERLQDMATRLPRQDLAGGIESLRLAAAAYGLEPVVRLADALHGADGARGLYFDRLRDAIGCERGDDQAAQAMLASVSVRLGA